MTIARCCRTSGRCRKAASWPAGSSPSRAASVPGLAPTRRCAIATGDYPIADRDGVVILPEALAAAAITQAEAVMSTESKMRQAILAGVDPREAYLEFGKF